MASKTTVAEEVVKFTVDGLVSEQRKTMTTIQAISKATAGVNKQGAGLAGMGSAVAKIATGLAAMSGFAGTRELDQFTGALMYLARTVASEFAPILRIVTVLIVAFTDGIRALPKEVKQAAVAIAAIVAVIMVFSPPVAALILIVAGLGIAFSDLAADADEMAATLEPIFAWFLRQWARLVRAAKISANEVGGALLKIGQIGENLINGDDWDKDLDILDAAIKEVNDDARKEFEDTWKKIPDQAKKAARKTADVLKGVRDGIAGLFKEANAAGPIHMKISAELESPASTWERIQKAFAEGKNELNPRLDEHLGKMRGQLDGIINAVKGKPPGVVMGA